MERRVEDRWEKNLDDFGSRKIQKTDNTQWINL